MLQAKLKNGRTITPAVYSREDLNKLKTMNLEYYCPTCGEKVILRAGEKVIAHFAHTADTSCPSTSGGEGPYHEQGKLLLYQWLLSQGLDVQLEIYLPEISQRPDLYMELKGKKIAIEYQCAKVPVNQIIHRTNGYQKAGIHVIWILGAKLMKRTSSNTLTLDSFSQTHIHRFSSNDPQILFYFCPLTSTLIKFQDFVFTSNKRAAGKLTANKLWKMNFKSLFSRETFSVESLKTVWKREMKSFRLKQRGKLYGDELAWHQWLYLKNIHFEQLPSYVYLPVKGANMIKKPNWIWQSRLIFDVLDPLQLGHDFSISRCIALFRRDLIRSEQFPLINGQFNPIFEYLQLLLQIGLLKKASESSFKKIQNIELYPDVERAVEGDMRLIDQIFAKQQPKSEHEDRLIRYTK